MCSILIRFQDRFEQINAHPTFLYMSIACVIGFIIHRDKLSKIEFWPDKWWKYFIGWVSISLLINEASAFIEQLKFLLSSAIMYYFATRCLTTPSRFLIFFAALAAVSAGMGYEAASSYLTDPNSPFAYTPSAEERRLFGWGRYANANEFGALMVIPLSGVFCLFFLSRSMIFKLLYLAVAGGLLFVTGLSYSRTCMVIAAIMVMAAAALWGRSNVIKKVFVLGAVGGVLLTALTIIPGPIQDRLSSILNYNEDASFLGRTRAWEQGFYMAKYQPIFGVGMNQWLNYHGLAPHNSFVQAMAENGFPGIFFYLAALFCAFKTTLRLIEIPESDPRYSRPARIIAIFSTSTLVGYIVYAFFGNQAYTPFMYIYAGFCAAVANLVPLGPEKRPKPAKKTKQKSKSQASADAIDRPELYPQNIDSKKPQGSRFPQAPS